ncbi:thiamine-phosphate kinase [Parvibaculaceae bacterium PLY_AMNH_Bact1]|nr:thiamine-phosphate kinase [Parvibaculaceae bacterium PLY_AMNH_Bact1]
MGQGGDANAVPNEFSLIEHLFEPLAGPEGLGLQDDAAVFNPRTGYDLVLTKDAIAEGRHYLPGDPADTVAKKLLRVNLSDLAAKGATPRGYLLSCAWSGYGSLDWMQAFAAGLKADQAEFGIRLWGGDTIKVEGPSVFSLTAIGEVPSGQMVTRAGAAVGDDLWITGTVGDAALGLLVAQGQCEDVVGEKDRDYLINRYRIPQPPVAFGSELCGIASGALDVSDGLLGDLEHLCAVSHVGARIDRSAIPLSEAFSKCLASTEDNWRLAFGGGDDYQILFAAPRAQRTAIQNKARQAEVQVTRIGHLASEQAVVVLDEAGQAVDVAHAGFTHF